MQQSIDSLLEGVVKFRESDFSSHKDLFNALEEGQNPHTLFVGCSDSRVVPSLITNTLPGELFVVRNIANIIPPYRKADEFLATTAAIEYAINELQVENVIICGHSQCGGCGALYEEDPKHFEKMPNVKKWLEILEPIKEQVLAMNPESQQKRAWLTEQLNIEKQLVHLFSYPGVKEKYLARELHIYGWHYIIKTGEVFSYNFKTQEFRLVTQELKL